MFRCLAEPIERGVLCSEVWHHTYLPTCSRWTFAWEMCQICLIWSIFFGLYILNGHSIFQPKIYTPNQADLTHFSSKGSRKKRDLAIFQWDKQYFCLIIKQKAGWLVGMVWGSTLCMYKQVSLSYKPLPAQFQGTGGEVFRGTSHDNLPDCRAPCEEDVVKPLPQQFCSHTHSSGHHLVEILSATHIVYTTYSTVYVHTLVKKSLEKRFRESFFCQCS